MNTKKFRAEFKHILRYVPFKIRKDIILEVENMAKNRSDIEIVKTSFGKTFNFSSFDAIEDAICLIIDKYPKIITIRDKSDMFERELLSSAMFENTLLVYAVQKRYEKVLCKVIEEYPNELIENWDLLDGYVYDSIWHACAYYELTEPCLKVLEMYDKALKEVDSHADSTRVADLNKVKLYKNLIKDRDEDGDTFLHIAAQNRLNNVLKKAIEVDSTLAKVTNKEGESFLHLVHNGKEIYEEVLNVNPSLFALVDNYGMSVAHVMLTSEPYNECTDILLKAIEKCPEILKIKNDYSSTIAHAAAHMGNEGELDKYKICLASSKYMPETIFMEDKYGKTFLDYIKDEKIKAECIKIAKEKLSQKLDLMK